MKLNEINWGCFVPIAIGVIWIGYSTIKSHHEKVKLRTKVEAEQFIDNIAQKMRGKSLDEFYAKYGGIEPRSLSEVPLGAPTLRYQIEATKYRGRNLVAIIDLYDADIFERNGEHFLKASISSRNGDIELGNFALFHVPSQMAREIAISPVWTTKTTDKEAAIAFRITGVAIPSLSLDYDYDEHSEYDFSVEYTLRNVGPTITGELTDFLALK